MNRPNLAARTSGAGLVMLALVAALLVAAGGVFAYRSTERDVTFTVLSKERVCNSSTDGGQTCQFLVFTDEGTFAVSDSIMYGRLRSSEVYGRLREDRTYSVSVAGFRVPFMSQYPNIVSDPIEVPS